MNSNVKALVSAIVGALAMYLGNAATEAAPVVCDPCPMAAPVVVPVVEVLPAPDVEPAPVVGD